ncbi:hypothetical protein [Anaerotignum sp.]|nr:hypothetical protein [Anaerotignum sp.]MBQ7758674.1 hypothetical protein [Anaerotignum sp.]
MLIYVIFMVAIAVFLYKESIKLLKDESTLLKEFCTDPVAKKTALSLMRKVLLSAIFSAGLMLACFVVTKATGVMPKPLAAISILCYTGGFIYAVIKAKNMH